MFPQPDNVLDNNAANIALAIRNGVGLFIPVYNVHHVVVTAKTIFRVTHIVSHNQIQRFLLQLVISVIRYLFCFCSKTYRKLMLFLVSGKVCQYVRIRY